MGCKKGFPFLVGLVLVFVAAHNAECRVGKVRLERTEAVGNADYNPPVMKASDASPDVSGGFKVPGAVIRPHRQATVGAEVQGVVQARGFEEGDPIEAGQVVYKISPDLFSLTADRSKERLLALEAAREQAKHELQLRQYLLLHNAATQQEVLRADTEAKISEHRANEARKDLDLALRDVRKSSVRAPFKGHIVTLFKEEHEPVQRFDRLFLIADTSKVHAVANVPETSLSQIVRGSRAEFLRPSGKTYRGMVTRIGKAIDPASRTKKVHVLIDNAAGKLEMGMLGTVKFSPKESENP
jgi:RND family efflux transporter MFP subunit